MDSAVRRYSHRYLTPPLGRFVKLSCHVFFVDFRVVSSRTCIIGLPMILKYQATIHLIYLIFKNETVFREYFQQFFFFFFSQKYVEKIR